MPWVELSVRRDVFAVLLGFDKTGVSSALSEILLIEGRNLILCCILCFMTSGVAEVADISRKRHSSLSLSQAL